MYKEYTHEYEDHYERALMFENQKYDMTPDFLASLRQKDMKVLYDHAKLLKKLIREMPGFEKVCCEDQIILLKESFFATLGIKFLKLFVNDNFYLMLDKNFRLTKEIFQILMNVSAVDLIFEYEFKLKALQITDQELGLMMPFFLSWNCNYSN